MMRQKSSRLCWSTVRSLPQPSAADGERGTGQIAPVWHSWNCCLLPGTHWPSLNGNHPQSASKSMLFYRSHSCAHALGPQGWCAHLLSQHLPGDTGSLPPELILSNTWDIEHHNSHCVCLGQPQCRSPTMSKRKKSKRKRMQPVSFPLV